MRGSESRTSAERRRLYRWVAAVGLVASAEEQRGSDTPETNAIGLLAAHAACEAMLGLIIGPLPFEKGKPARERPFGALLDLATPKARPRLPEALTSDLLTMHEARNVFVHFGTGVDGPELDRAIEAAHSLAEHLRLPGHGSLVGIATVVAAIIEIDAIGMWLRHADDMRRRGKLRWSADGVARALAAAVERTQPQVRTEAESDSRHMMAEMNMFISTPYGRMKDTAAQQRREVHEAIDALTRWVYPLALGTPPAVLADVQEVVGVARGMYGTEGAVRVWHSGEGDPTIPDLRRATATVSRIILRLWAIGSLAPMPYDGGIIERAQPFLTNPYGPPAGLPAEPVEGEPTVRRHVRAARPRNYVVLTHPGTPDSPDDPATGE